jgi:hypothetical protein
MRDNKGRFVKGHIFIKGGEKGWFKKGNHPKTQFKPGQYVGDRHPNWKGGKRKFKNYMTILMPQHPYARSGYVFEHRLVIEKIIGRYLLPKEKVHHLGAKDDNRPHMLMAFVNHSAHIRFEQGGKVKPEEIIFDGRKYGRAK